MQLESTVYFLSICNGLNEIRKKVLINNGSARNYYRKI